MKKRIKTQNTETRENTFKPDTRSIEEIWDSSNLDDDFDYAPFPEENEDDDDTWTVYSHVEAMQKLCEPKEEEYKGFGWSAFTKESDDIARKVTMPEYQNAQISLKIPAVT